MGAMRMGLILVKQPRRVEQMLFIQELSAQYWMGLEANFVL